MAGDADRFRPRDPSPAVSEQTPPTAPAPSGASDRGTIPDPRAPWHRPGQQPRQYAPPHSGVQRYAGPSTAGRDAPLIHPAAARADSRTSYGVPVYRAPSYAAAPQPQRGLSITALVLGLCSAVFGWTLVVVPLIGIVFGVLALRREPAGKGMAATGLIASGLGVLWIVLFYVLPLVGVLTALWMGFA